jgi:hypothetical protein
MKSLTDAAVGYLVCTHLCALHEECQSSFLGRVRSYICSCDKLIQSYPNVFIDLAIGFIHAELCNPRQSMNLKCLSASSVDEEHRSPMFYQERSNHKKVQKRTRLVCELVGGPMYKSAPRGTETHLTEHFLEAALHRLATQS